MPIVLGSDPPGVKGFRALWPIMDSYIPSATRHYLATGRPEVEPIDMPEVQARCHEAVIRFRRRQAADPGRPAQAAGVALLAQLRALEAHGTALDEHEAKRIALAVLTAFVEEIRAEEAKER